MRLNEDSFRRIERGEKVVERRLNDQKRRELSRGDVIEFILRDSDPPETLEKKIADLHTFDSFEEMSKEFPEEKSDIYQHYSKEDEQRFGVVAIILE